MSIRDLSNLSNLSGISRIRSSSLRPSEKADSMLNVSDDSASSSIREPTSKSISSGLPVDGTTNDSKIVKAIDSCENAIIDFIRVELIQESLHEATTRQDSGTLPSSTATKLNDILTVHEAKKYLQLPNTDNDIHEDLTLLGIKDLPKIQLSHNEKRDIRVAVEKIMREKLNDFIASYEKQGGTVKDAIKKQDSLGKSFLAVNQGSDLMRWKDHTDEICGEYYRDLLQCADLVYQWQHLKHIDMRELNLKNTDTLLLEAQVAEIQARITRKTCALKMLKETPKTVDAFRILSENLDAKILEVREKLRKNKALKTTYEDVFTSGYDQILNKYTELVNVIKKKEHLMEML